MRAVTVNSGIMRENRKIHVGVEGSMGRGISSDVLVLTLPTDAGLD